MFQCLERFVPCLGTVRFILWDDASHALGRTVSNDDTIFETHRLNPY